MNTPKKCGKMYIKFDEHNNPEYGFLYSDTRLIKFIPLSDKPIHTIILPQMVKNAEFPLASIDESTPHKSLLFTQKNIMTKYITGKVKICDGCFEGLKKARIVVPFENSIMLDWGCFDQNANIELVIPKNLALKQIYRIFDTGFDYERENWTIIGDKKINGQFGTGGFMSDGYSIINYDPADMDHVVANFSISYLLETPKNNNNDSDDFEK